MYNSTRLKQALQTLQALSEERGNISKQLAALRSRCQFREQVIDSLYDYYDLVSGDYYAVVDGLVRSTEAIEILRDYMQEHYDVIDDQMQRMRKMLDQPVKPTDTIEKLDKLKGFVFYMRPETPRTLNASPKMPPGSQT
ncbi:MAG: hypothetical protein IGS03_06180 [Candidatus Sericytochromatia bacterium]|nr:hypothetical protein [Candidatus Sericytochromatia bacterium]